METLTIRHMLYVTNNSFESVRLIRRLGAFCVSIVFLATSTAQNSSVLTIDLTKPQPKEQQGLGVPGGMGGAHGPNEYDLPIQIEIAGASVQNSHEVVIEVQLTNVGDTPLELPISRNISSVQHTPGTFRRELIFGLRPLSSKTSEHSVVGVTAGSRELPGSLLKLAPQESVRVLLPVEANWVKDILPSSATKVDLRVVCGEWALADSNFIVQAMARDVESRNIAVIGFNNDTPTAAIASR